MRRLIGLALGLGCVLALMLACFDPVVFGGQQFGYRDAAHYYYPLYERVEQEWSEHRLPLWDASENAGMPLLGNPTAAVLYPGKILYALMPYPWAARFYTIAHVVLALFGMYSLMRAWQTSRAGSAYAAIAYAFGAPILFQYCNVIYLVGAAWLPVGLGAVDRWLRTGDRYALLVLGLVLAMQTLGGDPQTAYVTGLCAGGYAAGLTFARRRAGLGRPPVRLSRIVLIGAGTLVLWTVCVLLSARFFPGYRPKRIPPVPLPWWPWVKWGVMGAWGIVAIACLEKGRRGPGMLATMYGGLALSAVLAAMLVAAQLLPTMEFTSRTVRAAEDGPHDIFPFSLEPARLVEFAWPNVFGSNREGNRTWASLIPPKHSIEVWVPSLYLGGLTLVLALSAFGLRGDGSRRVWLSWIAGLGLLASLGEFGGPLWVARNIPSVAAVVGEHDPMQTAALRLDGKLRDGDGSVYGLMATVLPGFGGFRYPSKLLSFVCLGLAGLSGIGLDRLVAGRSRRAVVIAGTLFLLSVPMFLGVQLGRAAIVARFASVVEMKGSSPFGPFDPVGAWAEWRIAMLHGMAALAAGLIVVSLARRAPRIVGPAALVVMTADLIVANAPLVITVPQSLFDAMPEMLVKIAEAEAADPSPGPFRIHRMPYWDPYGWNLEGSPDRHREMVAWERKTLQPKFAIPYGVPYTLTEGVAELYDYWWFFAPFAGNRNRRDGPLDDAINPRVVYFPSGGFDLWNTRYFILPAVNSNTERRAISSFLSDAEPIAPTDEQTNGPGGKAFFDAWAKAEDWRLLKNKNAFPRAWIVHRADFRRPLTGINRAGREIIMEELLYLDDPFWTKPGLQVQDLRSKAYVEVDDASELSPFLSWRGPDEEETATITELEDHRVEILVTLKSNGIVVLSDVFYPGWELTVDDEPATILRTNRMMRGAAVEAGTHRLVYRYRPRSVRFGLAISLAGLATLGILAIAFRSRRSSPALSSSW